MARPAFQWEHVPGALHSEGGCGGCAGGDCQGALPPIPEQAGWVQAVAPGPMWPSETASALGRQAAPQAVGHAQSELPPLPGPTEWSHGAAPSNHGAWDLTPAGPVGLDQTTVAGWFLPGPGLQRDVAPPDDDDDDGSESGDPCAEHLAAGQANCGTRCTYVCRYDERTDICWCNEIEVSVLFEEDPDPAPSPGEPPDPKPPEPPTEPDPPEEPTDPEGPGIIPEDYDFPGTPWESVWHNMARLECRNRGTPPPEECKCPAGEVPRRCMYSWSDATGTCIVDKGCVEAGGEQDPDAFPTI